MRIQIMFLLGASVVGLLSGCSRPAEEPEATEAETPVQTAVAPDPAPTPPAETAAAGEPETPAVVLPEGFTTRYHVHPDMTLTSVETVNAETAEYKVSGELRIGPSALLDYYVNYFQDNGWQEDMVMEQEGIVVVSFKKNGYLQYVDAREGGIGMKIDITTGQE